MIFQDMKYLFFENALYFSLLIHLTFKQGDTRPPGLLLGGVGTAVGTDDLGGHWALR